MSVIMRGNISHPAFVMGAFYCAATGAFEVALVIETGGQNISPVAFMAEWFLSCCGYFVCNECIVLIYIFGDSV